jgi:uncharacterized protein
MGSVAEFRINISKLSEGIHEYFFEAEPSKIGIGDPFGGIVKVSARLDKNSSQIFLQAMILADGKFVCDRCLDDFQRQLNGKYSMVYIQGDRTTAEIKDEEIQVLSADTNYIDLDEEVRQCVLLAIPQKLLCREECKGLCSACGINKNIADCDCDNNVVDSRWDALKKLSHN